MNPPSCEECHATWDGKPPCDECEKPDELDEENTVIFELWSLASRFGRNGFNGAFDIRAVIDLCRARDVDWRSFEQILVFEEEIAPLLPKKKLKPPPETKP